MMNLTPHLKIHGKKCPSIASKEKKLMLERSHRYSIDFWKTTTITAEGILHSLL